MSRKQLVEMTRRHMAHARAGTVDQAPSVGRIPASNYYAPERFEREMERIFKRLPLTLGFSSELREPGAYQALDVAGVPVLLSRAADGELRAFVNSCRHRGAMIVKEGVGRARRFVCPYHAWSYDQKGALVSVLDGDEFGDLDRSCHGLVRLPCHERAGLVFVGLDPEPALDIETFLAGYDDLLANLELDRFVVVGRQSVEGPNWKAAYDGYLDFYHLPILHRESFGKDMPNKAVYDAFGPHQRVSIPMPGMERLEEMPEDEWPMAVLMAGIWTIFPHISIAAFEAAGERLFMVSQLFPGRSAGESVTVQNFLFPTEPDDAQREQIDQMMKFLLHVVRDEDYYTGLRVQRALETGLMTEVLFGRNEGGGQRFHAWVEALVGSEDAALPQLFASRVGPVVE